MVHSFLKFITDFLTSTPVNFWPWLMLASPIAIIFCIAPDKPSWMRFSRLLFAAFFVYLFMNLSTGTEFSLRWTEYGECYRQSQFPDLSHERNNECKHHLSGIINDSTAVVILLFGWIPAAVYVGFWEMIWRIKHRKKIKELGANYKGKWFSNLTILLFLACLGFLLFIAIRLTLILLLR